MVDKSDIIADFNHRVHVVSVYYGGDVVFPGDFADKIIDNVGCMRVETGIGLIAKKIFRVHGDGTGNSNPFFHAAAEFRWHHFIGINQVYPRQAEVGPFEFFFRFHPGEHRQREHHIFFHIHRVKQGSALEQHSYFLPYVFHLGKRHLGKLPVVIKNLSRINFIKPYKALHQYRFSRTTFTNDQVCFPFFEGKRDVF